jgi:hypothetical protein
MTKSAKNMLIIGAAAVGGYLLFRQAQEKTGAKASALLGLGRGGGRGGGGGGRGGGGGGGGGRRGGGGHHHHHHHGRGGYAAPGFGPGWGWYGGPSETVFVIEGDRCIDARTGILLPPEVCDRARTF